MKVSNDELRAMGLLSEQKVTPPVVPPVGEKPEDKGSSKVKISEVIRWRVRNAHKFLSMGGETQVVLAIVGIAETVTRSFAARMEMDALIGNKMEIGSEIQSCFHGGEKKLPDNDNDVVPWISISLGILLSTMICLIPWRFDLSIIPSTLVTTLGLGVLFAGIKNVDIGYGGVLTVMGQRTFLTVSEGYHWTLWPIVGFETVDMRERIIDLSGEKKIVVIAGNTHDASDEIPDIAQHIDHNFRELSGVSVTQVLLSEVLPSNEEINEARERVLIELAEAESEGVEMKAMVKRAKELAVELGVEGAEAMRMVMMQAGHYSRTEIVTDNRGGGDAGAFLGTMIAAGQAIKAMTSGQKDGNKKGKDGNKKKGEPAK